MRISNGNPTKKESAFKAYHPREEHVDSCCELNEEESKFIRKLKGGSGKYKLNLTYKFFNCGKVGPYASKCPEKKKKEYDPREKFMKVQKYRKNAKKKSFFTQKSNPPESEGNQSSDEDIDDESTKEFMLMAIDNLEVETIHFYCEEAKVDLEGEMVSALEEIERLRKKNKYQKELLTKEKFEVVEPLLLQIEEGKIIQETLNQKPSEKSQACEGLEREYFF